MYRLAQSGRVFYLSILGLLLALSINCATRGPKPEPHWALLSEPLAESTVTGNHAVPVIDELVSSAESCGFEVWFATAYTDPERALAVLIDEAEPKQWWIIQARRQPDQEEPPLTYDIDLFGLTGVAPTLEPDAALRFLEDPDTIWWEESTLPVDEDDCKLTWLTSTQSD